MTLIIICLSVIGISTVEVVNKCKAMILARENFINEVSTVEVVNTRESMNLAHKYCIKGARA